jgi:hypothetical protein
MSKNIKRTKRLFRNRSPKLVGLVVFAVLVFALLEITDVTHFFHKSVIPPVIPVANNANNSSQQTGGQSATDKQPQATSDKNNNFSNVSSNSTSNSGLPLVTPFGVFVSNHTPGQNGAPTSIDSTCNTTSGANCYIKFTKGSITTKLPSKITSSDGTATWNWDIKDANLTSGEWQITAIATLDGQTKSAADPRPLTIK